MSHRNPFKNNYKIVSELKHFPTPSAGVITLEAKVYDINGPVDIGANRIEWVAGAFIQGTDFNIDSITSTTTGALITIDSVTATMKNVTLTATSCSKLFDLSGTGAEIWVFQEVVSFFAPSVATIEGFGNFIFQDCAFIGGVNLIDFIGTANVRMNINTTLFSSFTGIAIDLGTATMDNLTYDSITFAGIGGSSTDIKGLASSGNIKTDGLAVVTNCTFSSTGTKLDTVTAKDIRWLFGANVGVQQSTVSLEAQVIGSGNTTTIPAVNARVLMNVTGVVGEEISRTSITTNGVATYIGVAPAALKFDGNVLLEPASSTKSLACQFVSICTGQTVVTFTNSTNLVNDTTTPLVDGDQISFKDNAGTLPTELFETVIYYVVNQATNSFQLEYEPGDGVITFTDDGSGTNSYRVADLHGSIPKTPIAANSPRNLVPQALHTQITDDEISIVVINTQDAVAIDVSDSYYRISI